MFYGDAARHDVLERVGADRAAAIVITLNDYAASTKGVASVRSKWPKLPVFVRAHDLTHSQELMELGATGIVPETLEASLQLRRTCCMLSARLTTLWCLTWTGSAKRDMPG